MVCKRCGSCCKTFPIDVTFSDICRWDDEGRKDILQEISFINNYPKKGYGGFYIEKTLRNPKQPCPFFKNDGCIIHETLPLVCSDFPYSKDTNDCGCLCFEEEKFTKERRDEINANQLVDLKMANRSFNKLMAILVKARH